MELRYYSGILWKWKWLILSCGLIAALVSLSIFRTLVLWPYYQAKATVIIGDNTTASVYTFQSQQSIRETYMVLGSRPPITDQVINELDLDLVTKDLEQLIDFIAIGETQLVEIEVTYDDPQIAADIANEFAQQLINLSLSQDITLNEDSDESITVPSIPVRLVTPAKPPNRTSLNSYLGIVIAGVLGAIISIGIVVLFEIFKDRFEAPYEVEVVTGLPVLGTVQLSDPGKQRFGKKAASNPLARLETIIMDSKWIRVNLGHSDISESKAVLFTSPEEIEKKSLLANSLAVAWSEPHARAIMVDSKLRPIEVDQDLMALEFGTVEEEANEVVEEIYEEELSVSTSDHCLGTTKNGNPCKRSPLAGSSYCSQHSGQAIAVAVKPEPHLHGLNGSNMPKLNGTLKDKLEELKQKHIAIIVQGNSILENSEDAFISPFVDEIVLIIENRKTSMDQTKKAIHLLEQAGYPAKGVIFVK